MIGYFYVFCYCFYGILKKDTAVEKAAYIVGDCSLVGLSQICSTVKDRSEYRVFNYIFCSLIR